MEKKSSFNSRGSIKSLIQWGLLGVASVCIAITAFESTKGNIQGADKFRASQGGALVSAGQTEAASSVTQSGNGENNPSGEDWILLGIAGVALYSAIRDGRKHGIAEGDNPSDIDRTGQTD